MVTVEAQREFKALVERTYGYTFRDGEKWTLWGNDLIVTHPERIPMTIHLDGSREDIRW